MNWIKRSKAGLGMMLALATIAAHATDIKVPPHKAAIVLFDGKNLDHFETFVKDEGLNTDPTHVFRIEDGALHVSGSQFGYVITRDAYQSYYLRAEFKWGENTYAPRAGQARDSGILYNVQGEQKVWPRSVEFQIQEGCTGDFWMTDGAAITGKDGKRVTGPTGSALKIDRFGKGEWKNVAGFRDPNGEIEKPHGEWNVVELINRNGHVWQYVNGKLMNEGTDAFPSSGKVLFQSEGAEIFFRSIKLYPLK